MKHIYSNEEFMIKLGTIMNEDAVHMTQYYDINKGCDKITQLVNCLKDMSEHYVYKYGGLTKSTPDWSKWQIIYNNIFIEITFDYDEYNQCSGMLLKYIETDINETDIEKIIDALSFLQPIFKFKCKSKTRQDIEKYEAYMIEKETKRIEEIIKNHEKEKCEKEKIRQEIISKGNWINYIKNKK